MYIDLKFVTLITQQYCSIIILYVKLYEAIGSFPCFPFNNKMKNKKNNTNLCRNNSRNAWKFSELKRSSCDDTSSHGPFSSCELMNKASSTIPQVLCFLSKSSGGAPYT